MFESIINFDTCEILDVKEYTKEECYNIFFNNTIEKKK